MSAHPPNRQFSSTQNAGENWFGEPRDVQICQDVRGGSYARRKTQNHYGDEVGICIAYIIVDGVIRGRVYECANNKIQLRLQVRMRYMNVRGFESLDGVVEFIVGYYAAAYEDDIGH